MAKYTIEDIEILRQKSGISYEEAVNLLEYHNGSLARALVDLEKNGRIKTEAASAKHKGAKGLFDFLYRLRLKVRKGDVSIVNLSSLFVLFVLCCAPWVAVVGLVVCLVLGYRISVERNCAEFVQDSFDNMVKNARTNVEHTVSGFAKQFGQGTAEQARPQQAPEASQPRTESAPSGTRPVNVQFPRGGSVDVREDDDGYHEADIQ